VSFGGAAIGIVKVWFDGTGGVKSLELDVENQHTYADFGLLSTLFSNLGPHKGTMTRKYRSSPTPTKMQNPIVRYGCLKSHAESGFIELSAL
jgi:hypothetical protein